MQVDLYIGCKTVTVHDVVVFSRIVLGCSTLGNGEYGFTVKLSSQSKETKAVDWTVSSFYLVLTFTIPMSVGIFGNYW